MSYYLQICVYHLVSLFCNVVSNDRFVRICCQVQKGVCFQVVL